MNYIIMLICIWLLVSCQAPSKDTPLLGQTLEKIYAQSQNQIGAYELVDSCSCILKYHAIGESVDTLIEKINFGKLNFVRQLIIDGNSSYNSYYYFDDGIGIDILRVSYYPHLPPVTPQTYKMMEEHNQAIGFHMNTQSELNLVMTNIKQVAKNCGAILRDSL